MLGDISIVLASAPSTPVLVTLGYTTNTTGITISNSGTNVLVTLSNAVNQGQAISLTTTGTSGAATLVGGVLNVPQYSGGGGGSASFATLTGVPSDNTPLSYQLSAINVDINNNTTDIISLQNAGYITSVPAQSFSSLTGKPTTTSGYGITDAYPLSGNPSGFLTSVSAQSFSSLTGKPTTLSGYGITDSYPLSGNPSGFLTSVPGVSVQNKSANYQLTTSDNVIIANASGGAITITLPTAVGSTRIYDVKMISASGANTVTINTLLSQTIDGGSNAVLNTQYTSLRFVSDNANWFII